MSILFDNPPPAIGCGDPGDPIEFACRFDGAQYLHRTPTQTGNRRLMCAVFWAKRTSAEGAGNLFGRTEIAGTDSDYLFVPFLGDGGVRVDLHTGLVYEGRHETVAKYSDPASHSQFHIVIDTENPLESERIRITKDGVRQAVSIPYPVALNADVWANVAGIPFHIGANVHSTGADSYLKAILSEFIWFVGFAPDVSEFGYFNSDEVWVHKEFADKGQGASVYGANGFHLDFADPLDLGKDVSGNGNHFTAVGLTADNQVVDTPKNNIARLNPLSPGASACLKAGNTLIDGLVNQTNEAACTQIIPPDASGRWTARFRIDVYGNSSDDRSGTYTCPETGTSYSFKNLSSQELIFRPGDISLGYINQGDEIDFTLDFDADTIELVRNGVLLHTVPNANLGQGHWLYSAKAESTLSRSPADISVWFDAVEGEEFSTARLPCPAILNPDDYFTHRIKTGGGSVSDLPFNPTVGKAIVVSARMDTDDPCLISTTVNGAGMAWDASTNLTGLMPRPDGLTAFNPNGYSIGTDTAYQGNRLDLIWRASPKAGFDIVTINHTTGTPTTVPHFAGGVIEYGWCLPHSGGQPKRKFHHRLGTDRYFPMHEQGPSVSDPGWISSTANTITLGASMPSGVYTLPVWRSVEQFSSFGRYAPNDSVDGPFIPLDFSPRLFLPSGNGPNGTRAIFVDDLVVNGTNDQRLALEAAAVAETAYEYCDFLSNGVKARGVYTPINYSDTDFYYPAAWARTPGKFARAR